MIFYHWVKLVTGQIGSAPQRFCLFLSVFLCLCLSLRLHLVYFILPGQFTSNPKIFTDPESPIKLDGVGPVDNRPSTD